MWEDDRNKLGGRWLMTLNKQQRHNDLDRFWMETVRECLFVMERCLNIFNRVPLQLFNLSLFLLAALVSSWGVV